MINKPKRWREALFSLGVSNFLHLPLWQVLQGPLYNYYFPDPAALRLHLRDVLLSIFVVSSLLYGLLAWLREKGRGEATAARVVLNGLVIFPAMTGLWSLAVTFQPELFDRTDTPLICFLGAVWVAFILCWYRFPRVARITRNAMIVFVAALPISVWQVWQSSAQMPTGAVRSDGHTLFEASGRAAASSTSPRSPLVWVIFDELDQSLTFEKPLTPLPNFDRFRQESLYATAAFPSHYRTVAAIPSMLTGHLFTAERATAVTTGRSGLNNGYWENRPTLFSSLKAEGKQVAIVGWYNPYCSALNQSTVRCFSALAPNGRIESYILREAWLKRLLQNFATIIKYVPLARPIAIRTGVAGDFNSPGNAKLFRNLFIKEKAEWKSFLQIPYDFLVLHLSVPHLPALKSFSTGSSKGDYADNLEIADETLGEIRNTLERTGQWDGTTLLVTGDHHLRVDLWGSQLSPRLSAATGGVEQNRTVFLLKVAGQTRPTLYAHPFNTVLIHDLVLALEHDRSLNVSYWLDTNRDRFPVGPPPRR